MYSNWEEPPQKERCLYTRWLSSLFAWRNTVSYNGKHAVEHAKQGLREYAQQDNQTRHENYGLTKEFELENDNDRKGWKPGMLSY